MLMSFAAQHPGICACGCGKKFDRQELINYSDDVEGWVIEGHEQQARADRNDICSKCRLTHAGECF
jgi:hypothetical protein